MGAIIVVLLDLEHAGIEAAQAGGVDLVEGAHDQFRRGFGGGRHGGVICCFSAVQVLVLVLLCSQLRLRSLGALG